MFLDTNAFIDLSEDRDASIVEAVAGHVLYVSVASLGTWVYVYKHTVPDSKFETLFNTFNFIDTTAAIAQKSFLGPTDDYEDNIQLHSASDASCDVFITKDNGLLKLGYFGKVRIAQCSDMVY